MINLSVCKYYATGECEDAGNLIDSLLMCSRENICYLISGLEQKKIITYSIPQYSSFEDGTINLLKYLRMAGDFGPSYIEVGKHYLSNGRDERAYLKYGENHAKLAEILGVVEIKADNRRRVYLNEIGRCLEKRSYEEQKDCFIKLSGRIPIVQYAIKQGIQNSRQLEETLQLYLSESTASRRKKNTWDLVVQLRED